MSQSAAIRFTQDFSRRLFLSTSIAMALAAFLSLMVTVAEFNAGMRPFLAVSYTHLTLPTSG